VRRNAKHPRWIQPVSACNRRDVRSRCVSATIGAFSAAIRCDDSAPDWLKHFRYGP